MCLFLYVKTSDRKLSTKNNRNLVGKKKIVFLKGYVRFHLSYYII